MVGSSLLFGAKPTRAAAVAQSATEHRKSRSHCSDRLSTSFQGQKINRKRNRPQTTHPLLLRKGLARTIQAAASVGTTVDYTDSLFMVK